MKKLTLIVSLISISILTNAQEWRFGITAKPLITFLKVESQSDKLEIENKGIRLGFGYGLQTEYRFAENYSLQVDLNHILSGGKFSTVEATDSAMVTTTRTWKNLEFVEIPIAIRMKTNEIGYFTYFGNFGLAPGINIKSRGDKKTEYGNTTIEKKDMEFDSRLFSLSFIIGAGVMYSITGNTYLIGGLTFHNGLANIDGDDMDSKEAYTVKNSFIAIDLGVLF